MNRTRKSRATGARTRTMRRRARPVEFGAGGSVTSWEERSVAGGCGREGLRGSGADEHVIDLAEVMAQAHEHAGEAGHTRERVLEVRARFAGQVGNHEVDRMVERNLQDVFGVRCLVHGIALVAKQETADRPGAFIADQDDRVAISGCGHARLYTGWVTATSL